MDIKEFKGDKRQLMPLLLLADEQEDMINQYLERGQMKEPEFWKLKILLQYQSFREEDMGKG